MDGDLEAGGVGEGLLLPDEEAALASGARGGGADAVGGVIGPAVTDRAQGGCAGRDDRVCGPAGGDVDAAFADVGHDQRTAAAFATATAATATGRHGGNVGAGDEG